jgi:hypothetical protein
LGRRFFEVARGDERGIISSAFGDLKKRFSVGRADGVVVRTGDKSKP